VMAPLVGASLRYGANTPPVVEANNGSILAGPAGECPVARRPAYQT
jgi:hypothetical protein